MQKLVEKVLNIATLERGLITIEREEIDIHSIIFKSMESFRFEFCHKTVEVSYHFDATNPVILADKVHIRNIINNLVDNAVKYSDEIPKIEIKTSNLEGFIQIEISDKGKGIPKELQKKVFDKFFRGHSGNVHNVKGFGLGLYYAKTTVELHGGKIELDSLPNQGTRVIILLPQ